MELGGDPEAFWLQTPLTYGAFVKGRIRAAEEVQKGRLWLAYHTAALSRAKTLPPFAELAGGRSDPSSIARMMALGKVLAAQGLGTFTEPEKSA